MVKFIFFHGLIKLIESERISLLIEKWKENNIPSDHEEVINFWERKDELFKKYNIPEY